jgi:hypothetical protein
MDEEATAVLAVDQLGRIGSPDPVELDRRQREMAPVATVANEARDADPTAN